MERTKYTKTKANDEVEELGRNQRLSIPASARVPLLTLMAGSVGFSAGLLRGAKKSSLQYLAENSHRLPKTTKGWYFYHKTKNYKVMLGGIKTGFTTGIRIAAWAGLYSGIEAGVDHLRGTIDFGASLIAGTTTAAMVSAVNRFNRQIAARTVRIGMLVGLLGGLGQDLLRYQKGEDVWYIRRAKNMINRHRSQGLPDQEAGM